MIATALRSALPASVGIGVSRIDEDAPPLLPGEGDAVARAVCARRREFAAGRAAARSALVEIGGAAVAIPAGADRAPVWPDGFCGSITHGTSHAVAIAARRMRWASVGLDLDRATPLDPTLAAALAAPGDRPGAFFPPSLRAMLMFCVKEAAFKAQFPLTGLWLDFRDIAVALSEYRFRLEIGGVPLEGRWRLIGGFFAAWLLIDPEAGRRLAAIAQRPPE